MEVEPAKVAGDVDGFADDKEAGDGAGFHGAGVEVGGVDAAGGDFSLFESLRADGVELTAAELAFAGFKGGVGPTGRRGDFGQVIGEALRKCGPQSLSEGGFVAAGARLEERLEELVAGGEAGREVDVEGLAGTPVGRGLQNGGAAEAAMREQHLFAKTRGGAAALWRPGPGDDFSGDAGKFGPAGLISAENERDEGRAGFDDAETELAG